MITFVDDLAEWGSHSCSGDDQWGGAKRVLREMTQLGHHRRALVGGFEMEKMVAVRTRSAESLHQL